jgi:hypothetical protein
MDDLKSLKGFIDNSSFSPEIKKALFDCVLLELRKSPTSEYLRVIRNVIGTQDSSNEN